MDIKDIPLDEKYIQYLKDNGLFNVELSARNKTENLETRYIDYLKAHQDGFRQRRIEEAKHEVLIKNKQIYEQRLLKNQELAKKLKRKYEYALMTVKPEYRACELADMNLCFRSATDNTLDFLSPVHFDKNVLNGKIVYEESGSKIFSNKTKLNFDSWKDFEDYIENGKPTYSLVPPDDNFYDEYEDKEKKENLRIKKSYIQYKTIKEYLTLEKKIKKYENLIELCEKIPVSYDRAIYNIKPHLAIMICLYGLTKGDLDKFYELTRFCAKITDTGLKNRSFAIYADPSIYDALIYIIGICTNKLLTPYSFKSIWKKQVLLDLQKANMNNVNVGYVCIDEPLPDTETKAKVLKKIMKGNITTVKDAYYPVDLRIVNRIPMIYLTDNRENFQRMKNIFSATAIEFHSEDIKMPCIPPQDPSWPQTLFWLQNDFISLGMYSVKEKEKYPPKPVKVDKDDIMEDFIESVCILGDDYNCPIQELYSAYCDFYKKFYGNDYLTQIKFTKKFAAVTNLQKYRPHYKGQSNVYYFKGITIDEKKINPQPVKDEDIKKKQNNESASAKKYPTTFRDFCADIESKQSVLYQQQQENIRIFNYQKNLGL